VTGRTQARARVIPLLTVLVGGYLGALAADRSRIVVAGPSMAPTLLPGEVVLTVPAVGRWLRAGQVVVLRDPGDPGHLVIKRLARIGQGRVWAVGDDPYRSTDSRTWGWLPVSAVRRRVVVRWPDVRSPLRRVVADQPDTGRRASTSTSGSSSATSPSARRP
jgi:nickel-type superoxide dismutase maturation protease